jgi:hypothetical protein
MVMIINDCSFIEAIRFLKPFLSSPRSSAEGRGSQLQTSK